MSDAVILQGLKQDLDALDYQHRRALDNDRTLPPVNSKEPMQIHHWQISSSRRGTTTYWQAQRRIAAIDFSIDLGSKFSLDHFRREIERYEKRHGLYSANE